MSVLNWKVPRIHEPIRPWQIDWSSPFLPNPELLVVMDGSSTPLDLIHGITPTQGQAGVQKPQINQFGQTYFFPQSGTGQLQYAGASYPQVRQSQITFAAVATCFNVAISGGDVIVTDGTNSNTGYRFQQLGGGNFDLVKGGVVALDSGFAMVVNVPYFLAASSNEISGSYWILLRRLDTGTIQFKTGSDTNASLAPGAGPAIGGINGGVGAFYGQINFAFIGKSFISLAAGMAWAADPWVFAKPRARKWWFKPAAAVSGQIGGATDTLQPLQEKATGLAGVIAGTVDTLRPITESATGRIGAIAGTKETLQPLQTKATGIIGVIAGAVETLQSLTESGGGTVTSNNVIGGSSDTLQPLTEHATGIIGAIAGALDTLRPLQTKATGIIGVVGSALDTLQPLQIQATGFSATQLAPPAPTAGGAPAWWGYEGFDGTRRPWWYKDLKDKIRELEILRKKRIEIGLLPPDEIIEEAEEFVEEIPTPATADYYIAKYEALSERIEKYVDQLEEDADEEFIMKSAKFFFHHETRRNVWLSH